jgi:hypothetical protein
MKVSSPTCSRTAGKSKYAATCNYPLNINRRMSECIPSRPGKFLPAVGSLVVPHRDRTQHHAGNAFEKEKKENNIN